MANEEVRYTLGDAVMPVRLLAREADLYKRGEYGC
jgi:hypothetical protein